MSHRIRSLCPHYFHSPQILSFTDELTYICDVVADFAVTFVILLLFLDMLKPVKHAATDYSLFVNKSSGRCIPNVNIIFIAKTELVNYLHHSIFITLR